ncbi:hypothetical protein GDO81_018570 [Engystomops pustulosus]|uniref:Uncharacterized protein n=1 Tax=Engystomops pustulosus TaxID=76066 RepID=A0AAV6YC28_ENGPU|nr:hypothetical protein GDO81_018570 [Engystomops pustulosus]
MDTVTLRKSVPLVPSGRLCIQTLLHLFLFSKSSYSCARYVRWLVYGGVLLTCGFHAGVERLCCESSMEHDAVAPCGVSGRRRRSVAVVFGEQA